MNICLRVVRVLVSDHLAVLLCALLGTSACSAGASNPADTGELASTESVGAALAQSDWANGWAALTDSNGSALLLTGAPVACETRFGEAGGASLFRKGASNQFYVSSRIYSHFTPWFRLGTRTFTSKPACATMDGLADGSIPDSDQFVVVGKSGTANTYFIRVMKLGPASPNFGEPPASPTVVHDWTQISADAYASAPAATVHSGWLIVVGRRSDNRFSIRTKGVSGVPGEDPLPPTRPWDDARLVPALPTGWTAVGDPAIIHAPVADGGLATIATRATRGSTTGLFFIKTDGAQYSAWYRFNTGNAVVASDPALEVGMDRSRVTVYFIASNGRVYQASAHVASTTWEAFTSVSPDVFVSNPAVVGGSTGGDPSHMVFAKKSGSDQLYNVGTNPDVE